MHALVFINVKPLDNPGTMFAIFLSALAIGLGIKVQKNKTEHRGAYAIGWGIFYGSLVSLAIVAGLFAFLS